MSIWAAIFDWDGVIIHSAPQHEAAWRRMADELNRPLPESFFAASFGMKNEQAIPQLLGWAQSPEDVNQLALRKETIYRELMHTNGSDTLPGVLPWLEQLRTAGVPCIIASSAPRLNITSIIGQLGLRHYFQDLITAEDVTAGKPNPQVFLLAGQRLGQAPERCLVFEDAHVGIAAARAAGMRVVAVSTTHPPTSLQAADRVVARLDELNLEQLNAWFKPAASETHS